MSGNMERVLRLMAEKNASDVYLSANTPILIKIHGQILQLSDQVLTTGQTRQLLAELLTPQPARGARRDRRAQRRHRHRSGRQLPAVGLPAARLDRRGVPLHPARHPAARHPGRAGDAVHADPGKARPDPDGRRHRHRQEHDAGVDARVAQPAGHRPHPDDRGPDRVPVHEQEVDRQPARGRARHPDPADGAEERAAPGAGLHPDRRDPRPRDDDAGAVVRAVGPPRAGHAARQQQLPRARPHPVVLPARGTADAAVGPVLGPARGGLAAPAARQLRRPRAGGRGAAQHQAGGRADRQGRSRRRQGGGREVDGRGLADLRAGHRAAHHRRRGLARRRPVACRLADQPDVAAAERRDAGRRAAPRPRARPTKPSSPRSRSKCIPEKPPPPRPG